MILIIAEKPSLARNIVAGIGKLDKKDGYFINSDYIMRRDMGADLILERRGIRSVVQAKSYSGSVGVKAVQEVVAAKSYYKAREAFVVTNSTFTKSAIDLAEANGVSLWDGDLLKMMGVL